jgi:hypothetical protein
MQEERRNMNKRSDTNRTRPGGSARKKWERAQAAKAEKKRESERTPKVTASRKRGGPGARPDVPNPFIGERATTGRQTPCCTDKEAKNGQILHDLQHAVWEKVWNEATGSWENRPPQWLLKRHRRCIHHLPRETRKRLGLRR